MAKTQGSGTSWIIASAVLGIAFFFTLILAILFYTRVSSSQQQAQSDREALNLWANASERKSPTMLPKVSDARKSHVSVLSQVLVNNRKLKERIGVSGDSSLDAISQKLTTVGLDKGENLLDTIKQNNAVHENDKQLIDQLKQDLKKEQDNARQAVASQLKLTQTYNSSSAKLKGDLDSLQNQFMGFKAKSDKQANALINNVDKNRAEALATIAKQKSMIEQYEQEKVQLQHKIDSLSSQHARVTGQVDPSLLPDGRISSVLSDSSVVYINLGRHDHIVLGMTFEVFSANTGVIKDDTGQERGKATVEVVNVLDNASVCRVVRSTPGKEIIVGDVIANVVYDPKMKFNFYIFGDFDLDSAGQTSITDRRRIEGMIKAWGGRVESNTQGPQGQLKPETDFLILGEEPPLPREPRDKTDPVTIENYNKAKAKYETYQNLMVQAKKLSIPVLNQNRFLTMVGYYQR